PYVSTFLFFSCYVHLRCLHSFPTRRSSDLVRVIELLPRLPEARRLARRVLHEHRQLQRAWLQRCAGLCARPFAHALGAVGDATVDRKSTRLNSSHQIISYAVFCLKKKTNTT